MGAELVAKSFDAWACLDVGETSSGLSATCRAASAPSGPGQIEGGKTKDLKRKITILLRSKRAASDGWENWLETLTPT